MTADPKDGFKYNQEKFFDDGLPEPSYKQLLSWAKDAESKSLAFDIWARGNYVRYLLSRRKDETPSIIVPFKFLDELRWH